MNESKWEQMGMMPDEVDQFSVRGRLLVGRRRSRKGIVCVMLLYNSSMSRVSVGIFVDYDV